MTKINEQMGVLMGEKNGDAVVFGQLMSERWNVTGDIRGLCDYRYGLNHEARAGFQRQL